MDSPRKWEGGYAIREDSVVSIEEPTTDKDVLTEVLREGAQKLLAEAVQAELGKLLEDYREKRDGEGRQRVVRMGARADGKKELIAVEDGYRESEQFWWEPLIANPVRVILSSNLHPECVIDREKVGIGANPLWVAGNEPGNDASCSEGQADRVASVHGPNAARNPQRPRC